MNEARLAGKVTLITLVLLVGSIASSSLPTHLIRAQNQVLDNMAVGWSPSVYNTIIAFNTYEPQIGVDLNGDKDLDDIVIRYYDIPTETVINTGAVGAHPCVYEDIIVFATSEHLIGDLNGDGDTADTVIRYYNMSADTVTNTGVAGILPSIYGNLIAFTTAEWWIGLDLNGDGDKYDLVIRYYDLSVAMVTNTGAEGWGPSIYNDIIAFTTYEEAVNVDLNGDGDTADTVIRYYNVSAGTLTNTGAVGGIPLFGEGSIPSTYSNIIAFTTLEWMINIDLNGDQDLDDTVIRYFDVPTGIITNTAAVGIQPSTCDNVIAFSTVERVINADLNEDGDTADTVIRYYNIVTGIVTNTYTVGFQPSLYGNIIAFTSWGKYEGYNVLVVGHPVLILPPKMVSLHPTGGREATGRRRYRDLDQSDLRKLNASDDIRYQSLRWRGSYTKHRYIEFVFSANIPSTAKISSVMVTLEWQRAATIDKARIQVYDYSAQTWVIHDLTLPNPLTDYTTTIDVSSYINTPSDVNNLKILFQATNGSGAYAWHDLVEVSVVFT